VSGTITYKNQPVNGATLLLYPSAGGSSTVSIPVGQDGTFRTNDVPTGDYKIVVQPDPGNPGPPTKDLPPDMKQKAEALKVPPTIPIPEKYKTKEKTDLPPLSVAKGEQRLTLELKD
jgi:hypothetical protein